jgi:hypothetical protein
MRATARLPGSGKARLVEALGPQTSLGSVGGAMREAGASTTQASSGSRQTASMLLPSGSRLDQLVEGMNEETLEHALERLEDYEDEYPARHVEVAVEVLSNQLPRLRKGSSGSWTSGPT